MINFKKFLLTLICLICLNSNLLAENKVAYIDIDKILLNTESGKSLFNQLNDLEKLKFQNLENEQKKLKEEENKILSSKNLLTQDEYIKKVNTFKKKFLFIKRKKRILLIIFKKKEMLKLFVF